MIPIVPINFAILRTFSGETNSIQTQIPFTETKLKSRASSSIRILIKKLKKYRDVKNNLHVYNQNVKGYLTNNTNQLDL